MEDLDREPASERTAAPERLVISPTDPDVGARPVNGLQVRAQWMRMETRRAVGEPSSVPRRTLAVVRARYEVAPRPAHDAVAVRHRGKQVLQALARGHQNSSASALITQSASNSVAASRAMLVTHSRLAEVVAGLADQVETPSDALALEDLRRSVLGPVVGRDHEVDAGAQMMRDLRVDESASSRTRRVMTSFIADGD